MTLRLKLPPKYSLQQINPEDDPLPYYYWPVVGKLYRGRINAGLAYLPASCKSVLEVGYGSGVLMQTLSEVTPELYGIDIHPKKDEVEAALQRLGISAKLISGDARRLPFPDAAFDAVVAFSFMEHVKPVDSFIREMQRVLRPGGTVIIGMPMVNKGFNVLFHFLNYHSIAQQHITSPAEVRRTLKDMGISFSESGMPAWLPRALRMYNIFAFTK